MDRLLVILDLDETLVHVPSHQLARAPDFTSLDQPVYVRPHLGEFLEAVRERYRVAVWTTAERTYAEAILAEIIPWSRELAFLWCREECEVHVDQASQQSGLVKQLSAVEAAGHHLARVVVLDDSPQKHPSDRGNLLPIRAYCGESFDEELLATLEYLRTLEAEEDIRTIAKGSWRRRA